MRGSGHIHWGILGAGRIARKFASDLQLVPDAKLVAIGSRSQEAAAAFAKEIPVNHLHDSYEALTKNSEVDVIYIATPHHLHCDNTLLCLDNGKAVLCEKPFALDSQQVERMIAKARENKLFLMEALWTKFMPHYNRLMEMVVQGELGELSSLQVNFGFKAEAGASLRLFDPVMGGGSWMDIGIYNLFLTLSLLGEPQEYEAWMKPMASGVDEQCLAVLRYDNGAVATLLSSFSANLATEAEIAGSKGRIRLTNRFHEPSTTIEFYPGRAETMTVIPISKEKGLGYQYEIRHVHNCLRFGLTESPVMSFADSRLLMKWLEVIRHKAGIYFPDT